MNHIIQYKGYVGSVEFSEADGMCRGVNELFADEITEMKAIIAAKL